MSNGPSFFINYEDDDETKKQLRKEELRKEDRRIWRNAGIQAFVILLLVLVAAIVYSVILIKDNEAYRADSCPSVFVLPSTPEVIVS